MAGGGFLTPMVIVVSVSAGNEFYNTSSWTGVTKILVTGAIATSLLGLLNLASPQIATGIAWLAFTGLMLVNPTKGEPSPAANLTKIIGSNK